MQDATIHDLRDDRGEIDLVDETAGELLRTVPAPIAVVSDSGPCFRGETYAAAFAGDDPLPRHVPTRVRSPPNKGVIERFFSTLNGSLRLTGETAADHGVRRETRVGCGA